MRIKNDLKVIKVVKVVSKVVIKVVNKEETVTYTYLSSYFKALLV